MAQLVTRIPEDLAEAIDRLVDGGDFGSRSEVVRAALVLLIDRHRRAEIGERIVQGYRANPQTEGEFSWAAEATEAMIADEPW